MDNQHDGDKDKETGNIYEEYGSRWMSSIFQVLPNTPE